MPAPAHFAARVVSRGHAQTAVDPDLVGDHAFGGHQPVHLVGATPTAVVGVAEGDPRCSGASWATHFGVHQLEESLRLCQWHDRGRDRTFLPAPGCSGGRGSRGDVRIACRQCTHLEYLVIDRRLGHRDACLLRQRVFQRCEQAGVVGLTLAQVMLGMRDLQFDFHAIDDVGDRDHLHHVRLKNPGDMAIHRVEFDIRRGAVPLQRREHLEPGVALRRGGVDHVHRTVSKGDVHQRGRGGCSR
ncbi:hypothetical protein ACVK8N_003669 [Variovorax sp. PvP013_2]